MSEKFTTEKIVDLANKYNLQIKVEPQFNRVQFFLPEQDIDYEVTPLFQIDPEHDWNKEPLILIYDSYTIRLTGTQKQNIVYGGTRFVNDMEKLEYIVSYMVMLYTKRLEVKKQFEEGWLLLNIKKDF